MNLRAVGAWIYSSIFLTLALALAATVYVLCLSGDLPASASEALGVDVVATLTAGAGLFYLQRHVAYHMKRAAMVEEEKLRLMRIDELTGALTRRCFMEELKSQLGSFRQSGEATLLLIDLDEFKRLNDSFGHPVGDQALISIVRLARRIFADAAIGRLGGDEFAILLPTADLAGCNRMVEAFYLALRAPLRLERYDILLSVSIGIAAAPLHTTLVSDLTQMADLALYASKDAGRGRATVFDPEMLSDERQRSFMERELRAAIMLNQLELHYQPMVRADGHIDGLEALVRWNHDYRGMISPAEFVPVAERSMLIDALGEWVFRRACGDIDSFPGCTVSINVSAAQIQRDAVVVMMERMLAESGARAERFVIEITETVATPASDDVVRRIERLRSMGFRIALDDFGTGYCGFNYLKSLPIDCVKIDRSYIHSLGDDEVAQVFVASLSQIGRILGLTIVAEGIEDETERSRALASGCDRLQGYLICRPMPKGALLERYASRFGKARSFAA